MTFVFWHYPKNQGFQRALSNQSILKAVRLQHTFQNPVTLRPDPSPPALLGYREVKSRDASSRKRDRNASP
jgi:hypothetical protein